MYLLELTKHLSLLSSFRFRSAVRNPDGTIIKIRNRGHRPIYVRRSQSDLSVVAEVLWENAYGEAFSRLRKCDVYVDLGANIGLTSFLVDERFPTSKIIAFEPHPENFKILEKNVPRAEKYQAAVWSKSGTVSLGGESQKFDAFAAKEGGTIKAYSMQQVITLAGSQIDFLKIDIEGAEAEIFKDPTWLEAVDLLAIEFHGDSRDTSHFDANIAKYGLKIVNESRHTTVAQRQ